MVWAPRDLDKLISDPKEALDVFDFEPVAKKNVPPRTFGYLATGTDDEVTPRANRERFLKFQLRPRRLVDIGAIDMTMEIFGATYDSPIVIANPWQAADGRRQSPRSIRRRFARVVKGSRSKRAGCSRPKETDLVPDKGQFR